MRCKNPLCGRAHGRTIYNGFCPRCRNAIRRDFKRGGWKV